ncbi:hypothetical protein AAVH_31812 [Aphelenchoides avenae]|nr:hypothetical protein AAVH_31812 [Aphelenchus avenae]
MSSSRRLPARSRRSSSSTSSKKSKEISTDHDAAPKNSFNQRIYDKARAATPVDARVGASAKVPARSTSILCNSESLPWIKNVHPDTYEPDPEKWLMKYSILLTDGGELREYRHNTIQENVVRILKDPSARTMVILLKSRDFSFMLTRNPETGYSRLIASGKPGSDL